MYIPSLAGVAHHEARHIATLTEHGIEIFCANIVPQGRQNGQPSTRTSSGVPAEPSTNAMSALCAV
jgi:hypothetical protein